MISRKSNVSTLLEVLLRVKTKSSVIAMILMAMNFLMIQSSPAGTTTFSDDEFSPPDWQMIATERGHGGTAAVSQETSGNPGPSRRIVLDPRETPSDEARIFTFHFKAGAEHTPAAQGAIESLDYSEQAVLFVSNLPSTAQAQNTGPAIRQDGRLYFLPGVSIGTTATWHTISRSGLTADDFALWTPLGTDLSRNPDFCTGSRIEFGFYRARGTAPTSNLVPYADAGIDSWEIFIDHQDIVVPGGNCEASDGDSDGYLAPGDCDDEDPDVHPGAPELCDGRDNDCDGFIPAEESDADGDGVLLCEGDCDDQDCAAYPGGAELLDLVDNDCDGLVDEGLDADGDGIPDLYDVENTGDIGQVGVDPLGRAVCEIDPDDDGDGYPASADCDDASPSINPGAIEVCNGLDDDCDGGVDEEFDQDVDGFTICAADCDDDDAMINPDAVELPGNAIDEDCDGTLGACDPGADWENHGEYVRCVTSECESLVAAGALAEEACDQLVSQAAKSGIGKK